VTKGESTRLKVEGREECFDATDTKKQENIQINRSMNPTISFLHLTPLQPYKENGLDDWNIQKGIEANTQIWPKNLMPMEKLEGLHIILE
jgi:hypothetical protein